MSAKTLALKISGSQADNGDVMLEDFHEFCAALMKCLRVVEKIVEVPTRLNYRIVGLERASANIECLPVSRDSDTRKGDEVIASFQSTVRDIEKGNTVDERFSGADLVAFRDLVNPYRKGKVQGIRVGRMNLTRKYIKHIDELLEDTTAAHGDAKGLVEKLDVHAKNRFTLYPDIGDPIQCNFTDDLLEQVKASIKKNVTVSGTLHYVLGKYMPSKIDVASIEILPDDDDLPTLSDLKGMLLK